MQLRHTLNIQEEDTMSLIGKMLLFVTAFLAPLVPAMLATGFLLLVDFITGVWAAYKRGEAITSRRMGHGVTKILLYNLAIITGHVVEMYMITFDNEPIIPLSRIIVGFIALVEFKSISENIYRITGVKLWDNIREALKRRTDIEMEEKRNKKRK